MRKRFEENTVEPEGIRRSAIDVGDCQDVVARVEPRTKDCGVGKTSGAGTDIAHREGVENLLDTVDGDVHRWPAVLIGET